MCDVAWKESRTMPDPAGAVGYCRELLGFTEPGEAHDRAAIPLQWVMRHLPKLRRRQGWNKSQWSAMTQVTKCKCRSESQQEKYSSNIPYKILIFPLPQMRQHKSPLMGEYKP